MYLLFDISLVAFTVAIVSMDMSKPGYMYQNVAYFLIKHLKFSRAVLPNYNTVVPFYRVDKLLSKNTYGSNFKLGVPLCGNCWFEFNNLISNMMCVIAGVKVFVDFCQTSRHC